MVYIFVNFWYRNHLKPHRENDLLVENIISGEEPADQNQKIRRHRQKFQKLYFSANLHKRQKHVCDIVDQQDRDSEQILSMREANHHQVDRQHMMQQHGPVVQILLLTVHVVVGPLHMVPDGHQEEPLHVDMDAIRPSLGESGQFEISAEELGQVVALKTADQVEVYD